MVLQEMRCASCVHVPRRGPERPSDSLSPTHDADAQFAMAYTVVSCLASSSLAAALSLWYAGDGFTLVDNWWLPLAAAWASLFLVSLLLQKPKPVPALAPAEYAAHGLGPLKETATSTALYLDMLKRVLVNVVYHEQSHTVSLTRSIAEGRPDPVRADPAAFSLKDRALGEDVALNALSMVGLKRLDNIEACVTAIVKEGVAGDLIETGCAKGGSCILMKAVLRAHKDRERKVVCCDTFAGSKPPPPPAVALLFRPLWALVWLLAWVPSYAWHRKLYAALMRMQHSFPVDMEHTSSDTIRSFLFYVRNGHRFAQPTGAVTGTGLDDVKSHFARLGLLDDRVLFLKGFFAETLPAAPVEKIALLRLDGDLYASTVDALVALYPKLQRGGFCIVDDYYQFEECRQAIDEYRDEHGIDDELVRIDNCSVYWRRK